MNQEYFIKQCQKELDNTHMTWCHFMNKENDLQVLNETLEEKIGTVKQIKQLLIKKKRRNKHPVVQYLYYVGPINVLVWDKYIYISPPVFFCNTF